MRSKLIIGLLLASAAALAIFHNLALEFNWYYFYPSIDILAHLLGGFAIGLLMYVLLVLGIPPFGDQPPQSVAQTLFVVVFGTFLVSLIWEALELIFFLTKDAGLSGETLSDIIFGVVGAVIAWLVIRLLPADDSSKQIKTPAEGQGEDL